MQNCNPKSVYVHSNSPGRMIGRLKMVYIHAHNVEKNERTVPKLKQKLGLPLHSSRLGFQMEIIIVCVYICIK